MSDYTWPAPTADSLRAQLTATHDADDRAALARALEGCGVTDCGQIFCDRCNERISCAGPEPRACGVTCVDCGCDCGACVAMREDMRADLLHQINGESF